MGKSNTKTKIIRVDYIKFEQLRESASQTSKTLKLTKDNEQNKVYFVSFDQDENLHFIGRHSKTGFIDSEAVMREFDLKDNIHQIKSKLIELIDKETPKKRTLAAKIIFGLFAISTIIPPLIVGILVAPIIGVPIFFGTLIGAATALILRDRLRSSNNSGISERFFISGGGFVLGACVGAAIGTLVAPGVGTVIGIGIGGAVGFFVNTVLITGDYFRKKADKPSVLGELKDSLLSNEPLGEPVVTKNRMFHDRVQEQNYQNHVSHYKALFSPVSAKEDGTESSFEELNDYATPI